MRSYGDTRRNPTASSEPRALPYHDWLFNQIKGRRAVVVIPRTEESSLGNANVISDRDPLKI